MFIQWFLTKHFLYPLDQIDVQMHCLRSCLLARSVLHPCLCWHSAVCLCDNTISYHKVICQSVKYCETTGGNVYRTHRTKLGSTHKNITPALLVVKNLMGYLQEKEI